MGRPWPLDMPPCHLTGRFIIISSSSNIIIIIITTRPWALSLEGYVLYLYLDYIQKTITRRGPHGPKCPCDPAPMVIWPTGRAGGAADITLITWGSGLDLSWSERRGPHDPAPVVSERTNW